MKITEMIPKNMPQWAKDAMEEGQLFNVTFDKIKLLEEQLAESKPLDTQLTEAEYLISVLESKVEQLEADYIALQEDTNRLIEIGERSMLNS
jgi:hypothetical protein